MFTFANSICILNYTILASAIEKFPAREPAIKLPVLTIFFA